MRSRPFRNPLKLTLMAMGGYTIFYIIYNLPQLLVHPAQQHHAHSAHGLPDGLHQAHKEIKELRKRLADNELSSSLHSPTTTTASASNSRDLSTYPTLALMEKCRVEQEKMFKDVGQFWGAEFLHRVEAAYKSTPLESAIVIDVGANRGQGLDAIPVFGCPNKTKIFMWEPDEYNVAEIHRRAKLRNAESNIEVIQAIASPKAGQFSFWQTNVNQMGGITKKDDPDLGEQWEIKVEGVPVDDKMKDFPVIHWFKVDVERAEAHVFEGSKETLAKTMLLDYECKGTFIGLADGEESQLHLAQFFARHDFMTFMLGHKTMLRMDGPFWSEAYDKDIRVHNCLAIRRNHPKFKELVLDAVSTTHSPECVAAIGDVWPLK